MVFHRISIFLLLLTITFNLKSSANTFDADFVVAKDGSGDFTTLQAAISAVPSNQSDRRTIIFVKNGLYNTEKLIIPTDKINVSLIGESRDQTIISYHIYDCTSPESGNKCPAEDAVLWTGDVIRTSATLTIMGEGFRAENMTIENTAGPVGQALALTIQADKTVFVNCDIKGYQDTIYLWTAGKRSYFDNCLVVGRTDYIYGAGIAFFQGCEIRSWGGGWIAAPSTPQTQAYGFVFNECDLTYAINSPRNGDDGALVRFGRPWHEYPKVSWLNCEMTEKIHPEGWGDTWNMDYAATSTDLHLYEYNNTGAGADMSGRASWAGIKELTSMEAANYTAAKVLNGSDGWAPYEERPLVNTYNWDKGGSTNSWLEADNWNPDSIPSTAEIANVESNDTIEADGGTFAADLNLKNGAVLFISASSSANYAAFSNATIHTKSITTFNGKVAVKDTLEVSSDSKLTIDASLIGIHEIIINSSDTVILTADNSDYSGKFILEEGTLFAKNAYSLGKASVNVKTGATLRVSNDNALFPEVALSVVSGSTLDLSAHITLSEFYIDGVLQPLSTYNAITNPGLITGTGSVVVGRPLSFSFSGGTWDNASNYTPALLPEAGEIVYCEGEMETASSVNEADVFFVGGKGNLRLRGTHSSTGTLYFAEGNRISFATSGSGFSLSAPIVLSADINFEMSSKNAGGSSMKLSGSIVGTEKVFVKNTRLDVGNFSVVWLGGDNSEFNGIWDVTTVASHVDGSAGLEGAGENAFGHGTIDLAAGNSLILSHEKCAGDTLKVNADENSKISLMTDVVVKKFVLNNADQDTGKYSASSHPDIFEGEFTLYVGVQIPEEPSDIFAQRFDINDVIKLRGDLIEIVQCDANINIYSINGMLMYTSKDEKYISLASYPKGIYIVTYTLNDHTGSIKITH